jgi:putative oxidoreductase
MVDADILASVLLAIRLCLGLSFLVAGLSKVFNWRRFVSGVIDYQILPTRPAQVVGLGLPWMELALAVALLLGIAVPAAGLIAALLLASFTLAVVANLRRGREISCNCFGMAGTTTISTGTAARNALLFAMAAGTVILGLIVVPVARWDVPWASSPALTTSVEQPLLVALLVAWCVALVYLAEWTVDSHFRLSRLLSAGQPEGTGAMRGGSR